MSCGDLHDTDCSEVLATVYRFLDGEMEDRGCLAIRQHLEECAPCLRQYGIEREVKALVARCCGDDRAPDEVRARLVARLAQVQLEIAHVEFRVD